MSFRSTLVAATAFLAVSSAHMVIESPVPYSIDKLDNGPITKAQFPCKVGNGFTVSQMNAMAVGETQKLKFKGSAVHGGGSCQLSVTLDTEPTANSVFKVIKSIEGGCPGVGGPEEFEFTLPDSIPNGKASFAWSWFAKLSGAPEMYMNCAPIEVTGGASDDSAFQQLPDMFVANLDETCKSPLNKAVKFPNPGSEVQDMGTGDLEAPTGSGCGKTGSSPPSEGAPTEPSSAPSAPASGPSETAPASGPSETAPASKPTTTAGGVFAPGASSAAPTTLATKTAAPVGTGAPAAPSSGAPSTGAPSSGTPSTGGSTCSENGAIVCDGPEKFGLCNNGSVVFMPVAAGTTCEAGSIKKRGYNGRIARPRN
jgi:hypothetical protein